MIKHNTQTILNFLLITIALTSGCGALTAAPAPTLTPAPSQKSMSAVIPSSTNFILPTVTPVSTKLPTTPESWKSKMQTSVPTPEQYSISTQQTGSECLPPLTNFAFPVGVITDSGNIKSHADTLPPSYWQLQTTLPKNFDFKIEGAITVLANGDIWIKGWINDWNIGYFIYRPMGKSEIYLEKNLDRKYHDDGKYYVPDRLLQAEDGTLWGIGTSIGHSAKSNRTPLISRFNQSSGRFEYIENILYDDIYHSGVMDAKLDNNGFIWILIKQSFPENDQEVNGLYRFDTVTQKADYFLAMPKVTLFTRLQPINDGSIWILAKKTNSNESDKVVLIRYFPETGELQPYDGTFSYLPGEDFHFQNINVSTPLFLDKRNRLWIGNEGWLNEPTSEVSSWYRIIQSPIFIAKYIDGSGNLYRDIPDGMNESSNGMFWFWGNTGTVRLNPAIGEWCLFTTYSSPVVEDKDHNLWMIADNKLYKYLLSQK
jgi:hypothetical protein